MAGRAGDNARSPATAHIIRVGTDLLGVIFISIFCFFGPPGCGKTTLLTLLAQRELKKIKKSKSRYKHVYTNFPCSGAEQIDFINLGNYYYHDSLILLDELTLSADNRDWKNFPSETKRFICLHRHFHNDIYYTVQDWSRAEKTIRENTIGLYYTQRFLFWIITRPIYRTIVINEFVGDLITGYRFPNLSELLHGGLKFWFPRKAYKYFNSYDKYGFDNKPVPPSVLWK